MNSRLQQRAPQTLSPVSGKQDNRKFTTTRNCGSRMGRFW